MTQEETQIIKECIEATELHRDQLASIHKILPQAEEHICDVIEGMNITIDKLTRLIDNYREKDVNLIKI